MKYLLLANNQLKDLSGLEEKLAGRGLRRMTLQGNQISDKALMALDTDLQDKARAEGVAVGSGAYEGKTGGGASSKIEELGGIAEGDEEEEMDCD